MDYIIIHACGTFCFVISMLQQLPRNLLRAPRMHTAATLTAHPYHRHKRLSYWSSRYEHASFCARCQAGTKRKSNSIHCSSLPRVRMHRKMTGKKKKSWVVSVKVRAIGRPRDTACPAADRGDTVGSGRDPRQTSTLLPY